MVKLEALFLGPGAENLTLLECLIKEAVRDHAYWRRNFSPKDPSHITEEIKGSLDFLKTQDALLKNFRLLLAKLKDSVPFFSMRYQGHMNWENTLPSIVGYFVGMLYNSNNVTFEASPITSTLESLVIQDLCKMIGYSVTPYLGAAEQEIRSWGHIASGGSVANLEALWASRNLKFYPLAIQKALQVNSELTLAKEVKVALPTGEELLVSLPAWKLLNIESDEILRLPARIHQLLGGEQKFPFKKLSDSLSQYSIQNIGLKRVYDLINDRNIGDPVIIASCTKHYSISKAVSLLGLGEDSIFHVTVDQDARMDMIKLQEILETCLREHRPILTLVATLGTTEKSAVDPIKEIINMRNQFHAVGLTYNIHVDAAWGGYHISLIRGEAQPTIIPEPVLQLNAYVAEQFEYLRLTDSITIDPHKSGYIPYGAGTICYRNGAMKSIVTFSAPYISPLEDIEEPTVGIYGVEGSRPGAAAVSLFLSHQVIPLDRTGFGKIIGQCLFSSKMLYARLLDIERDDFVIIPFPRLPSERTGASKEDVEKELSFVRKHISRATNISIIKDHSAMNLLRELGADQNILLYAFNIKRNNKLNSDLSLANEFNERIYQYLRPKKGRPIHDYKLIVSNSILDSDDYGSSVIECYLKRMGIDKFGTYPIKINVIRSVSMNPWLTETENGSFIEIIEKELTETARMVIDELGREGKLSYNNSN